MWQGVANKEIFKLMRYLSFLACSRLSQIYIALSLLNAGGFYDIYPDKFNKEVLLNTGFGSTLNSLYKIQISSKE